jgi:hypothetical protein
MSEYQYYEFQTVDHTLSEKEMRELRSVSTRADITPTSFTNHYEWGDFKGDPDAWMEKYFDGYLYYANWGTRELQLALPASILPINIVRPYMALDALASRKKSGKLILKFRSGAESDPEYFDEEGCLSSLLEIRSELARGDFRSLYLGWLIGAQSGEAPDDAKEPPVPPNLEALSRAQKNLVDFFNIDPDLLAVAARESRRAKNESKTNGDAKSWIAALPAREKDELLVRLMTGDEANIKLELQSRFRREQDTSDPAAGPKRRTVAELLEAADAHRKEREQAQARMPVSKKWRTGWDSRTK